MSTKKSAAKVTPKKEVPAKEAPKAKAPSKIVERKISQDELLSLQKEGKLMGYDPTTKIGKVKEAGSKIEWPGGEPVAS